MLEKIQQIRTILDEIEVSLGATAPTVNTIYPTVFDLQDNGCAKLGVIESFRDKLKASNSPLDRRYEAGLPEYWFVQDMENYFLDGTYTPEMELAQTYACAQAASHPLAPPNKFQHWFQAYKSVVDDEGYGREEIIRVKGRIVGAFASDVKNASGTKTLKINPRVADVKAVLEANYKYFIERNKDAVLPIGTRLGSRN